MRSFSRAAAAAAAAEDDHAKIRRKKNRIVYPWKQQRVIERKLFK
jgi:hypothetical protein